MNNDRTVVMRRVRPEAPTTVLRRVTAPAPATPRPRIAAVRVLRYTVAVATGTYWALLIAERLSNFDPHLTEWFGGGAFWALLGLALWTRWSA